MTIKVHKTHVSAEDENS